MNFIDSFFTTEKALTKSINPTSIETRKDDEVQGQLTNVYFVEISIPDYINFLSANEDYEEKDVADAEKILANAIVNAEIFVDKSTGYVIRLVINSENLTQIQTPESEPLGFDARHITTTTVDLSRFNLPTSIKEPENYIEYQDAVGSETEQKVLGVFN